MYRKISAIVIPTVIAISIVAFMLYRVWDDLIIALQNSIPAYLVVGTVICLCAWWLRGWRYHVILKNLNYQVSVTASTACIFVSQTVNLIVPARLGDFVRVLILKHENNVTYSEGVSSLVVERVFDIFTVALLGAVALFFVVNVPAWFYTIIVLPIAAGVIFFVLLLFMGKFSSENRYIAIILTILHEIKRASLSLKGYCSTWVLFRGNLAPGHTCLRCRGNDVSAADPVCRCCSCHCNRKPCESYSAHTRGRWNI